MLLPLKPADEADELGKTRSFRWPFFVVSKEPEASSKIGLLRYFALVHSASQNFTFD